MYQWHVNGSTKTFRCFREKSLTGFSQWDLFLEPGKRERSDSEEDKKVAKGVHFLFLVEKGEHYREDRE